ncbi:serine-rich adhesin for platelets-like [Palaemon carinicauda]|uniref:serine-rich adhesin for platelets-like n=1 Tax=Palaemon carinicauda TaxID=392227 RepID=UPI0035B6435D
MANSGVSISILDCRENNNFYFMCYIGVLSLAKIFVINCFRNETEYSESQRIHQIKFLKPSFVKTETNNLPSRSSHEKDEVERGSASSPARPERIITKNRATLENEQECSKNFDRDCSWWMDNKRAEDEDDKDRGCVRKKNLQDALQDFNNGVGNLFNSVYGLEQSNFDFRKRITRLEKKNLILESELSDLKEDYHSYKEKMEKHLSLIVGRLIGVEKEMEAKKEQFPVKKVESERKSSLTKRMSAQNERIVNFVNCLSTQEEQNLELNMEVSAQRQKIDFLVKSLNNQKVRIEDMEGRLRVFEEQLNVEMCVIRSEDNAEIRYLKKRIEELETKIEKNNVPPLTVNRKEEEGRDSKDEIEEVKGVKKTVGSYETFPISPLSSISSSSSLSSPPSSISSSSSLSSPPSSISSSSSLSSPPSSISSSSSLSSPPSSISSSSISSSYFPSSSYSSSLSSSSLISSPSLISPLPSLSSSSSSLRFSSSPSISSSSSSSSMSSLSLSPFSRSLTSSSSLLPFNSSSSEENYSVVLTSMGSQPDWRDYGITVHDWESILPDLGELLGDGAYGQVYAFGELSRNPMCIKITEETFFKRPFLSEVKHMVRLQHTAVPRVTGIVLKKVFGIIMTRHEMTLKDWVIDYQPTVTERLTVLLEICKIINDFHQSGLCHNDLYLNNIMIDITDEGPKVTIIDFGLMTRIGKITFPTATLSFSEKRKLLRQRRRHPWYAPQIYLGGPSYPSTDAFSIAFIINKVLNKDAKGHLKKILNNFNKYFGIEPECSIENLQAALRDEMDDERKLSSLTKRMSAQNERIVNFVNCLSTQEEQNLELNMEVSAQRQKIDFLVKSLNNQKVRIEDMEGRLRVFEEQLNVEMCVIRSEDNAEIRYLKKRIEELEMKIEKNNVPPLTVNRKEEEGRDSKDEIEEVKGVKKTVGSYETFPISPLSSISSSSSLSSPPSSISSSSSLSSPPSSISSSSSLSSPPSSISSSSSLSSPPSSISSSSSLSSPPSSISSSSSLSSPPSSISSSSSLSSPPSSISSSSSLRSPPSSISSSLSLSSPPSSISSSSSLSSPPSSISSSSSLSSSLSISYSSLLSSSSSLSSSLSSSISSSYFPSSSYSSSLSSSSLISSPSLISPLPSLSSSSSLRFSSSPSISSSSSSSSMSSLSLSPFSRSLTSSSSLLPFNSSSSEENYSVVLTSMGSQPDWRDYGITVHDWESILPDLGELRGDGAYGQVYAFGESSRNPMCIKITEETFFKRPFLSEVKHMVRLQHTAVPRVTGIVLKKVFGIIMTRHEMTLKDWVIDYQPTVTERLTVLLEICKIINDFHQSGLCHNDLYLNNIMIDITDEGPKVTIIDFGLMTRIGKITFPTATLSFSEKRKLLRQRRRHPWYAPQIYLGGPSYPSTDAFSIAFIINKVLNKDAKGHLKKILNNFNKYFGIEPECSIENLQAALRDEMDDERKLSSLTKRMSAQNERIVNFVNCLSTQEEQNLELNMEVSAQRQKIDFLVKSLNNQKVRIEDMEGRLRVFEEQLNVEMCVIRSEDNAEIRYLKKRIEELETKIEKNNVPPLTVNRKEEEGRDSKDEIEEVKGVKKTVGSYETFPISPLSSISSSSSLSSPPSSISSSSSLSSPPSSISSSSSLSSPPSSISSSSSLSSPPSSISSSSISSSYFPSSSYSSSLSSSSLISSPSLISPLPSLSSSSSSLRFSSSPSISSSSSSSSMSSLSLSPFSRSLTSSSSLLPFNSSSSEENYSVVLTSMGSQPDWRDYGITVHDWESILPDLGELLGDGAYGQVYAFGESSRNPMCIKITEETFFKRPFLSEVKHMVRLQHTAVPRVTGIVLKKVFGIIMTRHEMTLKDWVIDYQPTVTERLTVLLEICKIINDFHQSGLCHNDLYLNNIMIDITDEGPKVTIIDFGLMTRIGKITFPTATLSFSEKRKLLRQRRRHPWYAPQIYLGGPSYPSTDAFSIAFIINKVLNKDAKGHLKKILNNFNKYFGIEPECSIENLQAALRDEMDDERKLSSLTKRMNAQNERIVNFVNCLSTQEEQNLELNMEVSAQRQKIDFLVKSLNNQKVRIEDMEGRLRVFEEQLNVEMCVIRSEDNAEIRYLKKRIEELETKIEKNNVPPLTVNRKEEEGRDSKDEIEEVKGVKKTVGSYETFPISPLSSISSSSSLSSPPSSISSSSSLSSPPSSISSSSSLSSPPSSISSSSSLSSPPSSISSSSSLSSPPSSISSSSSLSFPPSSISSSSSLSSPPSSISSSSSLSSPPSSISSSSSLSSPPSSISSSSSLSPPPSSIFSSSSLSSPPSSISSSSSLSSPPSSISSSSSLSSSSLSISYSSLFSSSSSLSSSLSSSISSSYFPSSSYSSSLSSTSLISSPSLISPLPSLSSSSSSLRFSSSPSISSSSSSSSTSSLSLSPFSRSLTSSSSLLPFNSSSSEENYSVVLTSMGSQPDWRDYGITVHDWESILPDLGELLGDGAYGQVYAFGESSRNPMCIKITEETFFKRPFLSEVKHMVRLQHTAVPRVTGIVLKKVFGIIMTRHEMTLKDWVIDYQPTVTERLTVLLEICKIINDFHQSGLCHNDLYLNNIMIDITDEGPKVTIIDFGLMTRIGKITFPTATLSVSEKRKLLRQRRRHPWYAPQIYLGGPSYPSTDAFSVAFIINKVLKKDAKGHLKKILNNFSKYFGIEPECSIENLQAALRDEMDGERKLSSLTKRMSAQNERIVNFVNCLSTQEEQNVEMNMEVSDQRQKIDFLVNCVTNQNLRIEDMEGRLRVFGEQLNVEMRVIRSEDNAEIRYLKKRIEELETKIEKNKVPPLTVNRKEEEGRDSMDEIYERHRANSEEKKGVK